MSTTLHKYPYKNSLLIFCGVLVIGIPWTDGAGPGTRPAPASSPAATMPIPMTILAPTTSPTSAPSTMPSTLTSKFTMNFKDMPIDPVLGFISQHTGVQILKDEPIDVRVTIMSKQPVSADEALSLLAAALKGNGFAVVRSGQVLHITSRDKARKGNVPVHFGNDPADIADTDELITQVVSVDNVSAAKLLTDLKPLIAEPDIVANEGSNSIIVTDTSAAVKRLVTIIALLDKHEASTSVVRVRVLKHSSAPAVAKLIDTLFKGSPGAPVPQDPRQMQQQGQQGPPPGPSSERHGVTVVTAADERTNTLLVMASNSTQKMIDDVLDRLDADNPNPAPATELRSYILRFAQADATARLINNVLKAPASNNGFSYMFYGFGDNSEDKKPAVNAVADDRSNTVVVSAPTERFKEIEALIQKLDASPMASSSELRVLHLKYAAADDVASIVTEMFNPKKTDDSSPPFRYFFMGSDPNAGQSKPVPVNVTSDMRTNTLLVSAPAPVLDSIEKVVKQLDSDPATEDTMFIYHLRNGQASHMEYTLNVLFGNIGQQGQNNQQNGNGQNGQQPGGPGTNFNQQQNNRQPVLGNSSPGNSQANSANRQRNQNNLHNESNLNPAKANNDLAGEVLVVADADTNSLLVTTASKYESQVKAIIAELDRPVPQVLIKCLVAEVTHDDSLNYGADFSVIDIHANGNGGSVANTVGAAAAALSTPSGVVAKIIDNDLQVTLQALAQANKLDVLSRPYILTSDNQDANITVGNEVPFVTDTFTDSTGGIHNNFQYQDIGIILDVTPHINPDGLVVMDVDPQISSLTGQNVTVQQGVNAPIYELRSAASRVAIRDGQTIVIGGLMQDQKTDHVNKIPLLGDIPLLGQLFQYHSNDKSKTELLIFLTPHVVPIPDELQQSTRDETRGTTLTPKAVAPGVFEEHMRGMQRGEVPQTQPNGASISPIKSIDMGAAATQP